MTLEELGNLCVDYKLHITLSPILKGVQINVYNVQNDENEFRIVNTRDIEQTIKDMIEIEEE